MEKIRKYLTDGLFYEVRITSRYVNLMGSQVFDKLQITISFEEYLILDILSYNAGICQRDLAKMLLRDRSNLGKIVSELEKKKLLTVKPSIRNNRSIKQLFISKKGLNLCDEIYTKLEPYVKYFDEKIKNEEQKMLISYLQNCRKIIDEIVETKI